MSVIQCLKCSCVISSLSKAEKEAQSPACCRIPFRRLAPGPRWSQQLGRGWTWWPPKSPSTLSCSGILWNPGSRAEPNGRSCTFPQDGHQGFKPSHLNAISATCLLLLTGPKSSVTQREMVRDALTGAGGCRVLPQRGDIALVVLQPMGAHCNAAWEAAGWWDFRGAGGSFPSVQLVIGPAGAETWILLFHSLWLAGVSKAGALLSCGKIMRAKPLFVAVVS